MIVRTLEDVIKTDRDVDWGNGKSRRLILDSDRMGYSVTETTVIAGTCSKLEYKNHLETCYCIEGEGEVSNISGDESYQLRPGTIYALDKNDEHYLKAITDMRLVCVFLPALTGNEVHDLTGSSSSSY